MVLIGHFSEGVSKKKRRRYTILELGDRLLDLRPAKNKEGLLGLHQNTVFLLTPIAFFLGSAFVVLLFTFGKAYFTLYPVSFPVHSGGYNGLG